MEELKDTATSAFFYVEMAYVYQGLNRVEESIYWYTKALRKREMVGTAKISIFNTAGLIAQQLIKLGRKKEAFALITRLKNQYPPSVPMERAVLAQDLGRCYEALGKFEMAEAQFLEMIKQYSKSSIYPEYMSIAQMDIGSFYVRRKRYDVAKPYLVSALQVPSGTNITVWKKDIHLMLFKVDSAQGNYVSSIDHLQKHNQLNDSIFNASKMREIEKMQAQFDVAQKEKEILALNNINKIQQQNIDQAATIRNFVFLGALGVLGFVYYRYKLKQSSNRQLEQQQNEINKKNQNLEHLVKEREWLLKEIHHRVKNNFQMVMSLLGTQTHYIKSKETLQSLEESQQRIYAMSLIHQRLYQSGNFSAINMKEYIHELVDYLRNSFTIRKHIFFDIQIEEIELNIAHALPIGLILNEAITNAIKYAFEGLTEGRIDITLRHKSEDMVELAITDNGVGLPPHIQFEHSGTMGLNLMRGLSEEIEGDISIVTHNGTAIQLLFNCELNLSQIPHSISTI
jgi:two-component sensor histidine kinase